MPAKRMPPFKSEEISARFWRKVKKTRGCWIWQASSSSNGYGYFGIGRRTFRINRVAWKLANGTDPGAKHVCHTCDERSCVRPSHLWLGTRAENMRDMADKGRAHPRAKLTEDDVVAILERLCTGEPPASIAPDFGVSRFAVQQIGRGMKWKRVLARHPELTPPRRKRGQRYWMDSHSTA